MDAKKRSELEAAGYAVFDDAADWVGMSEAERQQSDLKIALARAVYRLRTARRLTQKQAATLLKTGQSRVAAIEGPARGVGFDLMLRAFFTLGGSIDQLERLGQPIVEPGTTEDESKPAPKAKARTSKA